jgi:uncharacterized protein YbcI
VPGFAGLDATKPVRINDGVDGVAAELVRVHGAGEGAPRPPMKTQGEVEAAICEGISRFQQEYMGRGPKDIRAHLLGDSILVRLQGVLTAAEKHLVESLPPEKGRDLLKQVRTHLLETARPMLEVMVQEIVGIRVLSMHQDISTITGEEIIAFTLSAPVIVRETRPRYATDSAIRPNTTEQGDVRNS